MGAQLPNELGGPGGGPGAAEERGPEAAEQRKRNAIAVMPGMQAPHDPQAFSGVKPRDGPRESTRLRRTHACIPTRTSARVFGVFPCVL